MKNPSLALLVSAAFLLVLAAGCAEKAVLNSEVTPTVASDAYTTDEGRDLRTDLLATDVLDAPAWHVGHYFSYHIFMDGFQYHWNATVAEDRDSKWFLAPDDKTTAMYEAMFDFPLLGEFAKSDLTTTDAGNPFYWYEFPLTDNKTWTRTSTVTDLETGEAATYELTYTTKYNPAIPILEGQMPATTQVNRPGFDVFVRTDNGTLFAKYDYVPAIGWFAHYFQYDPTTGDADPGDMDWTMHMTTMGTIMGWSGMAYVDTPRVVLDKFQHVGADPSGGLTTQLQPHNTFTIEDTATYVMGYFFAFAYMGDSQVVITDPNNRVRDEHYEARDLDANINNYAENGDLFFSDAIPGEWKVEFASAGATAGAGGKLWELTEEVIQVGAHDMSNM